jgi:putative membrane protein
MRFKWLNDYWLGIVLVMGVAVLSLWLGITGRLALYIHPRYIVFTMLMSLLAVVCVIADMAVRKRVPRLSGRTTIGGVLVGLACLALCAVVLVLKPTSLTSLAAGQRGINTSALNVASKASASDLSSPQIDYAQFSLKEWASLLAQTTDSKLFVDKPAHISGFVSPTPDNNPNVFYLSRFVVTCCTVDARPIGVPIYKPGWQVNYKPDQWLDVQGKFMPNPENSTTPTLLEPKNVNHISEPRNPYVY